MREITQATLDAMQLQDPISAEIWRGWIRAAAARIVDPALKED